MNEHTFRNILVFLDRAPLTGAEAAAMCEAKAAIQLILTAAAETRDAPPEPPTTGGERAPLSLVKAA